MPSSPPPRLVLNTSVCTRCIECVEDLIVRKIALTCFKISFTEPKSPFVTQFDDIDPGTICNVTTIDNDECLVNRCYCTHVERVTLGNVVDLVWINLVNTAFSHPIHLHGYHFRVLAQIQVNYVLDSN